MMTRISNLALLAAATAGLALATGASAQTVQPNSVSGTFNGVNWTAANTIVGTASTATIAGGGSSRYQPSFPANAGVATLIMQYGNSGFICSGTLSSNRLAIITAAHCVTNSFALTRPDKVTAYFYGGTNPDAVVWQDPQSVAIDISNIFVNPNYTGQVVDQNDIAVVALSRAAPTFATGYDFDTAGNLDGKNYNILGYGGRSDTGGSVGQNLGTGRLRTGENRYDFAWGDAAFGGFFTDVDPATGLGFFDRAGGPRAQVSGSIVSDFDSGLAANDASCLIAGAFEAGGSQFCDLGRLNEASSAGGDSGGPQFVNGKLASVTSYGLTFGPAFGDTISSAAGNRLNSSYGEFNGFVPTFLHTSFLNSSLALSAVPEPGTWALMIAGFGFVGSAMRRRKAATRTTVSYA